MAAGVFQLPAFGFSESAHTVDAKVTEWLKNKVQEMPQDEDTKDLLKKLDNGKVGIQTMVPQRMPLRAFLGIAQSSEFLGTYLLRQCTKDQAEKLLEAFKISANIDNIEFSTTQWNTVGDILKVIKLVAEFTPKDSDEMFPTQETLKEIVPQKNLSEAIYNILIGPLKELRGILEKVAKHTPEQTRRGPESLSDWLSRERSHTRRGPESLSDWRSRERSQSIESIQSEGEY